MDGPFRVGAHQHTIATGQYSKILIIFSCILVQAALCLKNFGFLSHHQKKMNKLELKF